MLLLVLGLSATNRIVSKDKDWVSCKVWTLFLFVNIVTFSVGGGRKTP